MHKSTWVKFKAGQGEYPGAHRSPDGCVVGILVPGGVDSLSGKTQPASINVVNSNGDNIVFLADGEPRILKVDPAAVKAERATVPGDCPSKRVSHLVEEK